MSSKNDTRCDQCCLPKSPIIYTSMNRKLCSPCFIQERDTRKSLIAAIRNVKDKPPPFGYHFFESEYFLDQRKGKAFADVIFSSRFTGVVN